MSSTPLLSLVMVVKDEALRLKETLASVVGVVDVATILDTGSTDGTQDIIRAWGVETGVAVRIVEEPFVDFATSRNRALQIEEEASNRATFTLMLSGDEVVQNGQALRAFLQGEADAATTGDISTWVGAYCVEVESGQSRFLYPRVRLTQTAWLYEGVVHEQLVNRATKRDGTMVPRVPGGVRIVHQASDPVRRLKRFRDFDLPALARVVEEAPKTEEGEVERRRAMIFLAQTHESLAAAEDSDVPGGGYVGHLGQAMALYMRRADAGGDEEERALAHYRFLYLATVLNVYGSEEVLPRLQGLAASCPKFPEPHYLLAVHAARISAAAGYKAAVESAKVARAAETDPPRLPTQAKEIHWKSFAIAAACAQAAGQAEEVRKSVQAGIKAGGPVEVFQEFQS